MSARTPTPRWYPIAQRPSEPIGDYDQKLRRDAAREGSERLCDAIEDLVSRTAKSLNIPPEWRGRRLTFARAYLGMEVSR